MSSVAKVDASEQIPFEADAARHGGYLYTTNRPLSSKLATDRQTAEVIAAYDFGGKSVLDVGCGDAGITIDLYDRTHPARIAGIDPAANAIDVGKHRVGNRDIQLSVCSAYNLPYEDNAFDVAHLRGVLHHMDAPAKALCEAARVARSVVVLEPNGYNPVLKIIEQLSSYHREHGERSFRSVTIDEWMRRAGLNITRRSFCCLVPYFCPDSAARLLKKAEPLLEFLPGIRMLACGAYTVVGEKPPR